MVRYSFLVRLSHPLLHAGLSRRILDDLVGTKEQGLRNRDADLICSREIYDQLVLGWLFDGEFGWFGAVQNLTCKHTHAPEQLRKARAISQKAACFGKCLLPENRRQPILD